jgi:hypothetical protein
MDSQRVSVDFEPTSLICGTESGRSWWFYRSKSRFSHVLRILREFPWHIEPTCLICGAESDRSWWFSRSKSWSSHVLTILREFPWISNQLLWFAVQNLAVLDGFLALNHDLHTFWRFSVDFEPTSLICGAESDRSWWFSRSKSPNLLWLNTLVSALAP